MSYFPTADPQKLRNIRNYNASMHHFPPTPAHSQSPYGDLALTTTAEAHAYTEPQTLPWYHVQEPRGLGLLPMQSTGYPTHHTTAADLMAPAFSWSPDFATFQSSTFGSPAVTREPWSECYNPSATILPSAPIWDDSTFRTHKSHSPPGQSEYSTSTQASYGSTPYAHSESYMPTAGSPIVKHEETMDLNAPPHFQYIPEATPFDQAMTLNPGDLVTRPSQSTPRHAFAPTMLSNPTSTDAKPLVVHQSRPVQHRAFSFEDIKAEDDDEDCEGELEDGEYRDDRPKRGFTKPETASCSCDQCGKLFQRSYNLKAHMDTHNPQRGHPHLCEYDECDKGFVRRTDLLRHVQSVHLKSRNWVCSLCDSSFARKDTLRRHVGDGCPKRTKVKKRGSEGRRASSVASLRRASSHTLQSGSPQSSPLRHPVQLP